MALETNVDSLILDIAVKDNENGESSAKIISKLDKALSSFENTVGKLDTSMFKQKFKSFATSLRPFLKEIKGAKKEILALEKVLKKIGADGSVKAAIQPKSPIGENVVDVPDNTGGDIPSEKKGKPQKLTTEQLALLEEITRKNREYTAKQKQSYGEIIKTTKDADGTTKAFFEKYKDGKRILTTTTASFDKYGNLVENSVKKINETSENASKKGLSLFFRSLKRIALYRLIRTTLKLITSSMKEGIDNIVEFDASAKETMSEFTSSMTVMKNSVGVAIMPLLEAITPLVQGISRAVGTLANGISYLTAKLKGESAWLKVNTDYMKEYNKQSHLFSFDEFSSMSNTQDTSGMFETMNMSETTGGLLADMERVEGILWSILGIVGFIATTKLATWIAGGGLKTAVKDLGDVLKKVNNIGNAGLIAGAAFAFITTLINLIDVIKNWDSQSLCTKITAIVAVCLALAAVIFSILAAIPGIGAAKVFKAIAVGATGAALLVGTISAMRFADGGMMEQSFKGVGTMYAVAGEAGAEIVAKGSRGTGVTNITQFKQAMIGALIEYGAAKNNSDGQEIVVNLDGKEIARLQATNNADALSQKYNVSFQPR